MKPATDEELIKFKWAYDKMKEGFVYVLYEGNEIIKDEADKQKYAVGGTKKISTKTGARFITRAFFCKTCHKFFLSLRMKNIICTDCQLSERQRLARESNSEKYAPKSNIKSKASKKPKPKVKLGCVGCARLYFRVQCSLANCIANNFEDRMPGKTSEIGRHETRY